MKKIFCLLLITSLSVGAMTGCSKKTLGGDTETTVSAEPIAQTNKQYDTRHMITVSGLDYNLVGSSSLFTDKELGFGITNTDHMVELRDSGKLGVLADIPYAIELTYYQDALQEKVLSEDVSNMTEEEQMQLFTELEKEAYAYAGVLRQPKNDDAAAERKKEFDKRYKTVEKIGTLDSDTYYFGYNKDISNLQLTEEEQKELKDMVDGIEEFRNGICLFPPVKPEKTAMDGNMQHFEAETLSGKKVSQDVLKDYDITMVNIWATFCNPCIEEMPDLEKLYQDLPENVNMITICEDGKSDPELVQEIYQSFKGTFPVLYPDEKLKETLMSQIDSVPTTIFVDKNGHLVGEPIIGGFEKDVLENYRNAMSERLELVK